MNHCHASSRDEIPFVWRKCLKVVVRRWEKEFDLLDIFLWVMTRAQMVENYISYPNYRELVDYTIFLFHLIYENILIFLGIFEVYWEKALNVDWGLFWVVHFFEGWWMFGWSRTTSRFPTLRSSWTTLYSFSSDFIEKCQTIIRYFWFLIWEKSLTLDQVFD